MNQLDFKGRTAVVTGGMQGIGAAIVKRLRGLRRQGRVWDVARWPTRWTSTDPEAIERAAAKA